MSTLAYPSADFPGQPSVALDVPEGWEPVHAPGTTMAARLPRDGAFAPNVVVNIAPCDPTFRVEDSLETVLQANLFHVATTGSGSGAHLVQLTGAVGGGSAEADYELIRQVLTTVRVKAWDATGLTGVTAATGVTGADARGAPSTSSPTAWAATPPARWRAASRLRPSSSSPTARR